MRVCELLKNVSGKVIVRDTEVSGVSYDSRTVKPGEVFVAIKGAMWDGHDFLGQALERGASALIVQNLSAVPREVVEAGSVGVASVPDSRKALSSAAKALYEDPSDKLLVVGITGTKGKTTACHLVKAVLDASGHKTGLIGTIHNIVGEEVRPVERTTPESSDLQRLQKDMLNAGCTAVAMEVSSHALVLGRVEDIGFDVAVMTNVGRDHLDFHRNMGAYVDAKVRLFQMQSRQGMKKSTGLSPVAVVNADDPFADCFLNKFKTVAITYGFSKTALVRALDPQFGQKETRFILDAGSRKQKVKFSLPGRFNVMNALSAAAVAYGLGIDLTEVVSGLEGVKGVRGRLEVVPGIAGFSVWVDYAHTPESLKNILQTGRDMTKGRLIVVFGCGGDRDRGKRPIMGKVAGELADLVILTDDNPRTESESRILEDIESGLKETRGSDYFIIPDRKKAIEEALKSARSGDIVILAGKGHETYQIFKDKIVHFDDVEEARKAAARLGIRRDTL